MALASDKPGGAVSSIPMPACIQSQHEHLAEQVRCLKEEVLRLERRQFLIQSSRKSMLDKLCESLGWQGGTIHQVLAEVKRLRDANCGHGLHRLPDESSET